ncbi:anti-sigma factor antagonist [Candidatus Moduliflexus flocculans]|uniref:Anti-sigma factor antagonist n=1 Tax=Candidatus Moduliflexus flocculans TaxID=1499966 RepID=A0A0S6VTN7_9BACT|nr:anti-sigma factor antagonist [Candidatus Moduliflexus flocculans]
MQHDFTIELIGIHTDVLLITLKGSLDSVSAYHLQEQVQQAITEGAKHIIADFHDTEYLSSAGIGVFSALYFHLHKQQGRLIFIQVPPHVIEILQLTHLIHIFPRAETLEQALKKIDE